jgi:hypothetical protein
MTDFSLITPELFKEILSKEQKKKLELQVQNTIIESITTHVSKEYNIDFS